MPIILIDPEPKTLAFGDASIRYVEANADRVLSEIRRGWRRRGSDPDSAEAAGSEAAIRLCAEQVVGWAGVCDAKGTPIPWPAEGAVAPAAEDVEHRRALLRALPWNVLARLDECVALAWQESADSGKGSGSGSSG